MIASRRFDLHSNTKMSHSSPAKKKKLDLLILLVLVGVVAFQLVSRFSRDDSDRRTEDDLLLMGLDPQATRIPGRSVMGDANHDRLTETVSARNDQLSDLELMGLVPGREPKTGSVPPPKDPVADTPEPLVNDEPRPEPADPMVSPVEPNVEPPVDGAGDRETVADPGDSAEPHSEPHSEPQPEPEPDPASTEGIWVRSREGANPIRVEDHVSVDAAQLAEMAGFRNISTDLRYPPPRFNISGVGSGRLGTYVIVDNQMIRMDGQINSPTQPPRAWRLVEATANEVFWAPVE